MYDYYVVEEYSRDDLVYGSEAAKIPKGRIVILEDSAGIVDGWTKSATIKLVIRRDDDPSYLGYYFAVKLRPIDALEAMAIEAGLFNPKQGERDE